MLAHPGQHVVDVDLGTVFDKASKVPATKRRSDYSGFPDHGAPIALRKIQVLPVPK